MHIITGIIAAIVIFAVLVIVHEGGHFFVARCFDVTVNEFSVGMGPTVFQRKKGDTLYSVRAVPIGGYVAMEGETESSENENAFCNKPVWVKALVLAAGPLMNFLLAVLIIGIMITCIGTSVTPYISDVTDGSPAMKAGMEIGDRIVSIDGRKITKNGTVTQYIQSAAEKSDKVKISFQSSDDNSVRTEEIDFVETEDGRRYIGIQLRPAHNVFKGIVVGAKESVQMEKEMFIVLAELFTGRGSADDVVGPVGIVNIVDQTAQVGILNLIYLMALLSLNLGLVNILPFPALDGGRLLFLLLRGISGGRITDSIENAVNYFGAMVLMMFMVMLTMKDIGNIMR